MTEFEQHSLALLTALAGSATVQVQLLGVIAAAVTRDPGAAAALADTLEQPARMQASISQVIAQARDALQRAG